MSSDVDKQADGHASPPDDLSEYDTKDAQEMHRMGKKQQLQRGFEFWSILAFSCCLMLTWASQLVTFEIGLTNGGPEGMIIQLLVSWTAILAMVCILAEILSMWPSSSGQYHWVYSLSPPKLAPFLSYLCGWLSVLTWQSVEISVSYLGGTVLQGIIVLNYPHYHAEPWRGLLMIYVVVLTTAVINSFFAKWLPMIEWSMLFLYVAGFLAILITITVLSPSTASAPDVFQVFFNQGGWNSNGIAWWVGIQGIIFAWMGADGAIHMAEECRDASRVLPISLIASVAINGSLTFAILLAVLFCGGNLLDSLDSPTQYPIMQIFTYATGNSVAGGTGLSVILFLMSIFSALCGTAAASREMWAFARDNGLPGSSRLKIINKTTKTPLWTILVTCTSAVVISLIYLCSSTALNAVVSLTVAGFMSSYILPMSLLLYRRIQAIRGKGKEPPWGPWRLGKWSGVAINIYALTWVVLILAWSFFPPAVDPTPTSMNWSSLVYGTVIIFALAFWFIDGKRRFRGPVRDAADGAIEPLTYWDLDMNKE